MCSAEDTSSYYLVTPLIACGPWGCRVRNPATPLPSRSFLSVPPHTTTSSHHSSSALTRATIFEHEVFLRPVVQFAAKPATLCGCNRGIIFSKERLPIESGSRVEAMQTSPRFVFIEPKTGDVQGIVKGCLGHSNLASFFLKVVFSKTENTSNHTEQLEFSTAI